jgi:hypothetical protein
MEGIELLVTMKLERDNLSLFEYNRSPVLVRLSNITKILNEGSK